MSSSEDEALGSSASNLLYKKLRWDGTVNPAPLGQPDYDRVHHFIKTTFPNASKVQRNIEDTLKRTFILGTSRKSKKKKIHVGGQKNGKSGKGTKKAINIRELGRVPKKLPYEEFLELNNLWKAYVADLFQYDTDTTEIQSKLNKMDLHGAHITVIQSNCKSFEHLDGIVVQETKNTFVIVTSSNFTKTLPKAESVFDIKLEKPKGVMRIAGNSFLTRPAERVSKKIKSFMEFVGPSVYKSKLKWSSNSDDSCL